MPIRRWGSLSPGRGRNRFQECVLLLKYLRSWLTPKPAVPEPPICAELFSIERLEICARELAGSQPIAANPRHGRSITARLKDNSNVLTSAYRAVAADLAARRPISPGASWLLDNFHIVEEQLRQISNDLPRGFYRRLPKLAEGSLRGYPRVFGISWTLVAHTDSALDAARIIGFVEAYETVQPLDIGELWALAITLRLVLVENLRRLAEAILMQQAAGDAADKLASRIFGTVAGRPQTDDEIVACLAAAPWSNAFAVELTERLRHQDPGTVPALRWLNERLVADGSDTSRIVHDELQRQSATDVTVRNVITSMRLVSMMNWAEVFETLSPVDAVLRGASNFGAMDFPTRDHYRRIIELLARQSGLAEVEVAQRAITTAAAVKPAPPGATPPREADPGYYLINNGRPGFEAAIGCRVPPQTALFRLYTNVGILSYVAMIALLTLAILGLALWAVVAAGADSMKLGMFAMLGVVPASDIAVALVNRWITRSVSGSPLPAMALRQGITAELRTMIVIPTLLVDAAGVVEQLDRLEDHHLGNPDEYFSFALISDWLDAPTEHLAGDQALVDQAAAGIAHLNHLYGPGPDGPRFFLLHRHRMWNAGEGKWIGWERKRGKLRELNRLLRGATDTSFMAIGDAVAALPTAIRYVITLDVDTRLPLGTARRLVGKMAHTLNRAEFDVQAGIVTRGHGMLQPRVTPSLPLSSKGSLFQRAFSGPNGLDPYAFAVSDVYQDLFEEGSFTGKGIYEVDSFEAALNDQFPESTVLSHDLLEGIFARAALAADIEVVEEFPSRYAVAAARQHRWVRGDWQLLPWILGLASFTKAGPHSTSIPLMGRWKLIDNLRRSLSAPTALLALLIGWLQPPAIAEVWTGCILLTICLPPLLPAIASIMPTRAGISLRNHFRTLRGDFALGLMQSGFLLVFLAHQSWLMIDAIARTMLRVFIRRQHLLQWVTAAQSRDAHRFDTRALTLQVVASAACCGGFALLIAASGDRTWIVAVPLLTLWLVSPLIAWRASLPPAAAANLTITDGDAIALRLVARRTWRFFEGFITADDNMLPPDNFQETPRPVVAHRTSPTNISLYLLSIISARDFGWIGTEEVIDRCEATFAAMDRLERFRGHFFNWYDTTDLRSLEPRYVSSVDSGNLAGHLLALRNALQEIAAGPVVGRGWTAGIEDGAALLAEAIETDRAAGSLPEPAAASMLARLELFNARLSAKASAHGELSSQLRDLGDHADALAAAARPAVGSNDVSETLAWTRALVASVRGWKLEVDAASQAVGARRQRLASLADRAKAMFDGMAFGFLFDPDRELLSIGYRVDDSNLDANFYDLLASEARLASFIAIAKGDLPAKHWFRLGRTLTPIDGSSGLISWSGSMFEYLMPSLVMRAPAASLLAQTNELVVWRQRDYAEKRGMPWGISESEYNARDLEQTYQYSSFGIPDLGYKRGLADNLVIAPYASGLAAMIDPAAAAANFDRMAKLGARGVYGWYEALDYTRSRLPDGTKMAIVRAYMAHHQGMVLVGIGNALHDGRMRARFHAEPIIRASELLLQERMPRDFAVARSPSELTGPADQAAATATPDNDRHYSSPHSRMPRTHLLSNGRLSTMLTATGSGYCRWNDIAITRWREDVTCDERGAHIFLRDCDNGAAWSAGFRPTNVEPAQYDVAYSESAARITRIDDDLETALEVMVSPDDDAEVRQLSIVNHGTRDRFIDVTSYAELVLARQSDDLAHPAFGALFVETEFIPDLGALLATRRRRNASDPEVWAAHLSVVDGEATAEVQYETDRARFIGRGRTVEAPAAITNGWPLSNSVGALLDPVFSLRRQVRVPVGSSVRISFWTLVAASREAVIALADRHHDTVAFERTGTLAWTQAQMQLRHLGINSGEAQLFQRLASHVLFSDPALRPSSIDIQRWAGPPSTLWAAGISGDLPIVMVRISDDAHLDLVRDVLRAHEYWRLKRLAVDVVIINERGVSYAEGLQAALDALVRIFQSLSGEADRSAGAVFMLRADLIAPELGGLIAGCARAVLYGDRGTLADQLRRAGDADDRNAGDSLRTPPSVVTRPAAPPLPTLEYFNGSGGFDSDGRDYVTILDDGRTTPAPWLNVIANPGFGFQASADGSGFTWARNSQQNQLTPWSNDPVCDPPGEAIYIRDEDTGAVWTPTGLPIRDPAARYTVRHSQGFSCFEMSAHGTALSLTQFVPVDDPIKISVLRIHNESGRPRSLSVTAYVEWVLGQSRSASAPFVITEVDPGTGAIFARNRWNAAFGDDVAFADLNGAQTSLTADRTEFLGRNGAMERPQALASGRPLSGSVGAGLDPCAALQTRLQLPPGATAEIVCFLGQADCTAAAQALLAKYRAADLDAVLAAVTTQWDATLGVLQISTPDRALDVMFNRWMPYQTLACRVWARTAFYQASGAYGFRDQLQDVLALCVARPEIARAHLLRAAARQFAEGDVQHWWLPESGRGVRTRVSDDRAWLAYAIAHYVMVTGDAAILDEPVPFIAGPVLADGERDAFFQPTTSAERPSLFDHMALALDASLATGAHGLPLIGTGDWNDGLDAVGAGGHGESVWLGWFLYGALSDCALLADHRGLPDKADAWRRHGNLLRSALDDVGWDGDWYRRAFFDDGTVLGSVGDRECRIDSIAQSWAVISGAGDPARATRAMAALNRYLVRRDDGLVLLFEPPFDKPDRDPGYIKGYPPGIRENGGQYTHAATWAALAFALQGDGDRAGEIISMLNPIRHSDTAVAINRYKVEPYAICADVYSQAPHVGRGGWTWYTGSAAWMYRVSLEGLLGFRLSGATLRIDPCIPRDWPSFGIVYRHGLTTYDIVVDNPDSVCRGVVAVQLDAAALPPSAPVVLVDDGATHRLHITLGSTS
ncbi:GH36-type glycosyl hydrolase domain-containing protein [Polymorphobacter sp. PAMC 29334]|uniref:GH36-type glycosyl hydrolase domain-containing protein n=1 Tax=Polymorphobacter sp. PAMC 29334 TaxID=2862331 RepID=UPI00351D6AD7